MISSQDYQVRFCAHTHSVLFNLTHPIIGGDIMALTIVFHDDDYTRPYYYNGKKTRYLVSKDGKVYNTQTNKYMKTDKVYNTGYRAIRLTEKAIGLNKKVSVHRIVAETFIPNPDNLPEVNHIDLNKQNNHLSNLEWVSKSENSAHKVRNNVGPFLPGEANKTAKYTDSQVEEVCEMLSKGCKPIDISNKTGVSTAMISMIKIGKVRTHQSSKYNWEVVHKSEMVGDKHPNNVINSKIAKEICGYIQQGYSVKQIAEITGVGKHIISDIKHRGSWTSVSDKYDW